MAMSLYVLYPFSVLVAVDFSSSIRSIVLADADGAEGEVALIRLSCPLGGLNCVVTIKLAGNALGGLVLEGKGIEVEVGWIGNKTICGTPATDALFVLDERVCGLLVERSGPKLCGETGNALAL